jgi:hypothetical protein
MKKVIVAGLFLLSAAGCAAPIGGASDSAEEKEYVTGSNIPRRERSSVKTIDPAELERQRNSMPANGQKNN